MEASVLEFLQKKTLREDPKMSWRLLSCLPSSQTVLIIEIRFLNRYIRKYWMAMIRPVVTILEPGDFMATLDLKEANLHVSTFQLPESRCVLKGFGDPNSVHHPSLWHLLGSSYIYRGGIGCGHSLKDTRDRYHPLSGRLSGKGFLTPVVLHSFLQQSFFQQPRYYSWGLS